MTGPHIDDIGDWVCQHGTAMDVHCCHCHSGFVFDMAHECPDTIADILREVVDRFGPWHDEDCPADDTCDCSAKTLHDRINTALSRQAEYDSGSEECAICHKATQNGVWGCDSCWDEVKALAAEFLRLRRLAHSDGVDGSDARSSE
jgi:hypothetical protein